VRVHRRHHTVLAAVALVLALAAAGVVLGLALGNGGGAAARTGPLSRNEVRSAAQAFAAAYRAEDPAALRRVLTRNAQRYLPGGVARGREQIIAQYQRQFDGKVRGYDLSGLEVTGGTAGRATGDYRVQRDGEPAIEGHLVLGVVRDRGQPRIALIAATPRT
jgi:hypothetical protein